MPGFTVSDGPYQNTRAPNPRCCKNPRVLCPDCARKVLGKADWQQRYYDVEDDLTIIRNQENTMNRTDKCTCGCGRQRQVNNADLGPTLELPRGLGHGEHDREPRAPAANEGSEAILDLPMGLEGRRRFC